MSRCSARRTPGAVLRIALAGEGLAFAAAKESEDGEWLVLRCVNLFDTAQDGAWRFGRPVSEAKIARLDETIVTDARCDAGTVHFSTGARAVVTVLVRFLT
jgi:alpha-mannosidase